MSLLFTYGTLQRGQRNHWRLYGAKFLDQALVHGQLFQFPLMNFPLLRRHPTSYVRGEIYEVGRTVLFINDDYEVLYKRVKMLAYPVHAEQELASSGPVSCWGYEALGQLPLDLLARRLPEGYWPSRPAPLWKFGGRK